MPPTPRRRCHHEKPQPLRRSFRSPPRQPNETSQRQNCRPHCHQFVLAFTPATHNRAYQPTVRDRRRLSSCTAMLLGELRFVECPGRAARRGSALIIQDGEAELLLPNIARQPNTRRPGSIFSYEMRPRQTAVIVKRIGRLEFAGRRREYEATKQSVPNHQSPVPRFASTPSDPLALRQSARRRMSQRCLEPSPATVVPRPPMR